MPFAIENDTHWRTDDIKKLLAAAVSQGANSARHRQVYVEHGHSRGSYTINDPGDVIRILLPIEGPREVSPLVALAAANYDVPIILPSTTGFLLNALAFEFYRADNGTMGNPVEFKRLQADSRSTNMPSWAPKGMVIRKYADPAKDTTFKKYVAGVDADIKNAEKRVETYTAAVEKAKRSLTKAKRDLKRHQTRLKTARERRGL